LQFDKSERKNLFRPVLLQMQKKVFIYLFLHINNKLTIVWGKREKVAFKMFFGRPGKVHSIFIEF